MAFVVAIDGPAGAGKSTVARRVAHRLGLTYIDTGAMYRAVAWLALQDGVQVADGEALAALARNMKLELSPLDADYRQRVIVNDRDVTEAIRTPEVSGVTSAVSALPPVRRVIVEQQRRLAQSAPRGVAMEGRDIGTVVFPDADVKIFLTASPEQRARRRAEELAGKGQPVPYEQVLADQNARDARDSQREDSPLKPAPDSLLLPTDNLDIDQVVARILALCRGKQEGKREPEIRYPDFQARLRLDKRIGHHVVERMLRLWFRLYARWEVIGLENLPHEGAVLLAANHSSYLDPLLGSAAVYGTRRMWGIAKIELWKHPMGAYLMDCLLSVPVQRHTADRLMIRRVLELLAQGHAIGIFPEGTRTSDGRLQPAEPGLALLVKKSGAPVIPVAIIGAYEMLPRNSKKLKRGRLKVVIGKPLTFRAQCPREEILTAVMAAIADLLTANGRPTEPPRPDMPR